MLQLNYCNTYSAMFYQQNGLILQLVNYKGFPSISRLWSRLVLLLNGQQNASKLSKFLLQDQMAQMLEQLSQEEILELFNGLKPTLEENRKPTFANKKSKNTSQSCVQFLNSPKVQGQQKKCSSNIVRPQHQKFLIQKTIQEMSHQRKKQILKQLRRYSRTKNVFDAINDESLNEIFGFAMEQMTAFPIQFQNLSRTVERLRSTDKKINKQKIIADIILVDSALFYSLGFRLRAFQVLTLILLLYGKNDKLLLQVQAGEGKSIIIACLAAILSMNGLRVNIIIQSQFLAKKEVENKRKFYDLMNITVSHNFQKSMQDLKVHCQKNTIIYGTFHSYQIDALYSEYKDLKIRERGFDVIIADEIDSLLVDQSNQPTLLSTAYPGFSQLTYIMRFIWNQVRTNLIYVENGKLLIKSKGQGTAKFRQAKQIICNLIEQQKKVKENQGLVNWRQDIIDLYLENWIECAYKAAYEYKQNVHYIIKSKKVAPFQHQRKGINQDIFYWQNGLLQFLEMKHELNITVFGLTSNFISNINYFSKYKYLYGLTGTIGSNYSANFLHQTYNVQLVKVPSHKKNRSSNEDINLLYNYDDLGLYITNKIEQKIKDQKSVVIICENNQEAEKIKTYIKSCYLFRNLQVKLLKQKTHKDWIDSKQIVIATKQGINSIKSPNVMSKGLHVIIGYMPKHERQQTHCRGLASKIGEKGSSEVAINYVDYCKQDKITTQPKNDFEKQKIEKLNWISKRRALFEQKTMKINIERAKILNSKDKMFILYCKQIKSIPNFQQNYIKQLALEEAWAKFLKKIDKSNNIGCDSYQKQAQRQINSLKNISDERLFNSYYLIYFGINLLLNQKYSEAIPYFLKASQTKCLTPKIIGGIYAISCQLMNDPSNKQIQQGYVKKAQQIIKLINQKMNLTMKNHIKDRSNQIIYRREFEKVNPEYQFDQKGNYILNVALYTPCPNLGALTTIQNDLTSNIESINHLQQNQKVQIEFTKIQDAQERFNVEFGELKNCGLFFRTRIKIQKQQIPIWKNFAVFTVGFAQIIGGVVAKIVTCGFLADASNRIIKQGLQQCYDSIWNESLIYDLTKYYQQEVVKRYGCTIPQLSSQKQKQQPNKKSQLSIKNEKVQGSKNLSLIKTLSQVKIVQQKYRQKDRKIERIKQKFNTDITEIIKKSINELNKQAMSQINGKKLDQHQIFILISNQFKNKVQKDSLHTSSQMYSFFEKNINDQKLSSLFAKQIELNKEIKQSIQNITSSHFFKNCENRATQIIKMALIKTQKKKSLKLKKMIKQFQDQKIGLSNNQRQSQMFKNRQMIIQSWSQMIRQLQCLAKDPRIIISYLEENNVFNENTIVNKNAIKTLPLSEFVKQALEYIQYPNKIISFEEALENAIFNEVASIGHSIIDDVCSCQEELKKDLQRISKLVYQTI